MSSVAGHMQAALHGPPPNTSSSLAAGTSWSGAPRGWAARQGFGTPTAAGVLSFATSNASCWLGRGPGSDLFERILVTPRVRELGFVLPQSTWYPEVWNTYRRASHSLAGIGLSGSGGLQVDGPATMPYYPGQSQVYSAAIPLDGPATISQVATWQFAGILGTDMAVSGTRIMVFPHSPDWSEPFREVLSWKTRILVAYKGSEQRYRLRSRPRYTLSFRVVSMTDVETAGLEALLFGWHGKVFGVPCWPEKSQIQAALAPGDDLILADTSFRPGLQLGGFLLLWSNHQTWEAFQIATLADGSVGIGSPVTRAWAPGAWIVPLRRGRLMEDLSEGRPTNWVTAGQFTFSCEGA